MKSKRKTRSDYSYEEYVIWCKSQVMSRPVEDYGEETLAPTVAPVSNEACPVTVRSRTDHSVVLTPRGSR